MEKFLSYLNQSAEIVLNILNKYIDQNSIKYDEYFDSWISFKSTITNNDLLKVHSDLIKSGLGNHEVSVSDKGLSINIFKEPQLSIIEGTDGSFKIYLKGAVKHKFKIMEKLKFKKYLVIQSIGDYNMMTQAGEAAEAAQLTSTEYELIQAKYKELLESYPELRIEVDKFSIQLIKLLEKIQDYRIPRDLDILKSRLIYEYMRISEPIEESEVLDKVISRLDMVTQTSIRFLANLDSTVNNWAIKCSLTDSESELITSRLVSLHIQFGSSLIYDRDVMMAADKIDQMAITRGLGSDISRLPMYGMTLNYVNPAIESIIDEFKPLYAVSAGEDSIAQSIDKESLGTKIHPMHPIAGTRSNGSYPVIFKYPNDVLEISQFYFGDLGIYLLHDYYLTLLLTDDYAGTGYYLKNRKSFELAKRILIEIYGFKFLDY